MIKGSCLCGGVRFEIARASGPFELCHCSRCRKATGSAFLPGIIVRREDFHFIEGQELVRTYVAPIREAPPAYQASFCSRCGSPVPDPNFVGPLLEFAAGVLDDDPGVRPERHIMVEVKSPWFQISDNLPQLELAALIRQRQAINEAV